MAPPALPVRIRPTPSGWVLLFLAIYLLGSAINNGNNLLFLIATGALALALAALVMTWNNLRGLAVMSEGVPEGFVGAEGTLPLTLMDLVGRRRHWLSLACVSIPTLAVGARLPLSLRWRCDRRGQHVITAGTVTSRYPLGVFAGEIVVPAVSAWVYPNPEPADPLPFAAGGAAVPRSASDAAGDYWMHRGYLPDEDARLIDWRATARSDLEEWVIVRSLAGQSPWRLWFDLRSCVDAAAFERFLSRVTWWLLALHRQHDQVFVWDPTTIAMGPRDTATGEQAPLMPRIDHPGGVAGGTGFGMGPAVGVSGDPASRLGAGVGPPAAGEPGADWVPGIDDGGRWLALQDPRNLSRILRWLSMLEVAALPATPAPPSAGSDRELVRIAPDLPGLGG